MPSSSPDKLIVTNVDKLKAKYGAGGAAKVTAAVKKLVVADAKRGINSVLIDVSDAATMAPFGVPAINAANAGDAKRNKQAIDAAWAHGDVRPQYLLLLGSSDVVPHVPLDNPMDGDGDANVPSDLPYACDKPYSTDVQDYIAPTRVVGRLPNVTNDKSPNYLVGLLGTATSYTGKPATDYSAFLGITAQVWKTSTSMSLTAIFGTDSGIKVAPPDGPKWTAVEAKRLAHFINCHGAPGDPHFYGQKGASYPIAHDAAWMSKKVANGTVLAAECCYGAELYDPAVPTAGGQMGMGNTYLGRQAYAYFGSTTIAYGPADANDLADLICQYFGLYLGNGASSGRACLMSRLDYVTNKGGVLTPTDLKTLAQFLLLGDPSLTPVTLPSHVAAISTSGAKSASVAAMAAVERHERLNRRAGLMARAAATTSYRLRAATGSKGGLFAKLLKLAADHGIKDPDVQLSFEVAQPAQMAGAAAKGFAPHATVAGAGPRAIHAVLKREKSPPKLPHLPLVRGVQAVEYADSMDARVFVSR